MPPRQCIAEELNNLSLSESLFSSNERLREVENDDDDDETTTDERQEVPRNITFVLLYTWFAFSGRGVWNQNCLATLVFLLRDGDPKSIGFITAAMGISQLCVSIPTGILADKYRRDILLKIGAFFGAAACGATIYAALHPGYLLLVGALILWGIHWGIVNTAITALFSDSIPDGERSFYFTRRAIIINFGNMCGPAIALIMFAVLGDKWTVKDCAMIFVK
jgi:MFS family permease